MALNASKSVVALWHVVFMGFLRPGAGEGRGLSVIGMMRDGGRCVKAFAWMFYVLKYIKSGGF